MNSRDLTEMSLTRELENIHYNYMQIWDEYYKTSSRDSAFLKDLADALIGISAVMEVYVRDKYIHPDYALEKLKSSKTYIDAAIRYYEIKLKEGENNDI